MPETSYEGGLLGSMSLFARSAFTFSLLWSLLVWETRARSKFRDGMCLLSSCTWWLDYLLRPSARFLPTPPALPYDDFCDLCDVTGDKTGDLTPSRLLACVLIFYVCALGRAVAID